MEALFTADYKWLWMIALAAALFIPVRQLIWVLYVRRAARRAASEAERRADSAPDAPADAPPEASGALPDEAERARLKSRAGFTAALLCFVFAYLYTSYLFQKAP
jgi:hypothetical protein